MVGCAKENKEKLAFFTNFNPEFEIQSGTQAHEPLAVIEPVYFRPLELSFKSKLRYIALPFFTYFSIIAYYMNSAMHTYQFLIDFLFWKLDALSENLIFKK